MPSVVDGADRLAEDSGRRQRAEFHANPVQHGFIYSRAEADLFASRFGEGKSAGLVWAAFYHAKTNPAGIDQYFVRDTWENLRESTFAEWCKWFPIGVAGEWKESTKTWVWGAGEMRGTRVHWIGLDNKETASKLQSRPMAGFFMDEPAPAAASGGIDRFIFEMLIPRLRQRPAEKAPIWYAAKLAENNPDESHWTYELFVDPGRPTYKLWHTREPENLANLPRDYYQKQRLLWKHRPDFLNRFVEGKFGFQQQGQAVTPEWSDDLHLALGLVPMRGVPLDLLWDGGLNPTCIVTQVSPLGVWNILESYVAGSGELERMGMRQLIETVIAARLVSHYRGFTWEHIGDPNLASPEQSDSRNSAARVIRELLGGPFRPGPVSIAERVEPLRAVLSRTQQGRGIVQVDREHAKEVWYALRGGWYRPIQRSGLTSEDPVKNVYSHPGDCMGVGAARLFPLSLVRRRPAGPPRDGEARYWGGPGRTPGRPGALRGIGFERPGTVPPPDGHRIG